MQQSRCLVLLLMVITIKTVWSQPYDTLSLPHRYAHEVKVEMMDERKFIGPLIDVNDTAIVVFASNISQKIEFIPVREIHKLKLYRSDFERSATTKIVIISTGTAAFFTALNYYRARRDQLDFKDSEWLLAGMVALISMPLAAVISDRIYNLPREKYVLSGSVQEYKKFQEELQAYSLWTYVTAHG